MEDSSQRIIRVGSRSSQLAMIQSRKIVSELEKLNPSLKFEIKTMKTIGDNILDKPLPNIGLTNLFTKELETALAASEVDLIVHSLKDLPTTLPSGMMVSAIFIRDSPTDALVLNPKHFGKKLHELPNESVIGTSSLRRIAQLKRNFPTFSFKTVRGNLNTRLNKLDTSGEYDALILATSGMVRMGWGDRVSEEIDPKLCMYAIGQGALAVESRTDDSFIAKILAPLNDIDTLIRCTAEREFLNGLGGGCSVPVGTISSIKDNSLILEGAVFSLDGSKMVKDCVVLPLPVDFSKLHLDVLRKLSIEAGAKLWRLVLDNGAGEILQDARKETDAATEALKIPQQ